MHEFLSRLGLINVTLFHLHEITSASINFKTLPEADVLSVPVGLPPIVIANQFSDVSLVKMIKQVWLRQ